MLYLLKISFSIQNKKRSRNDGTCQGVNKKILGVSTGILHGIIKGKKSIHREELADLYLPLFRRIINSPNNNRSRYQYFNRIMIRFFPKDQTKIGDFRREINQFYTKRPLYYHEEKSAQLRLEFYFVFLFYIFCNDRYAIRRTERYLLVFTL